jgi:hypothetical protein
MLHNISGVKSKLIAQRGAAWRRSKKTRLRLRPKLRTRIKGRWRRGVIPVYAISRSSVVSVVL